MRRRYVQLEDGSLVETTGEQLRALPADSGALWGDRSYDGQRASDGTPIDSRTKHRQYMRDRGLTTVDDYTNEFKIREKQREAVLRGVDPSRKHDIVRALEQAHGRR